MKKNRIRTLICGAVLGADGNGQRFDGVAGRDRFSSRRIHERRIHYRGRWRQRGPDFPWSPPSVPGFRHELWCDHWRIDDRNGRTRLALRSPGDIAGSYRAIGAGGALAAGAAGVVLQNARGVVLELHGVRVGVQVSAAVGGVTISMQ
jgi:hypothetical protein